MVYINQLAQHVNQTVTLNGWVYNFRTGKGIVFVILRDGTGLCQCVISQQDVAENVWADAEKLTQETSLSITGRIVADERSVGGFEMHVTDIKLIQVTENYPITPKEHGIEFLMENRHLWLRSQKQWAVMRVRNEIIFAIHRFFQDRGFVQMDAPIFTGNAAEGTTTLFHTKYFEEDAYLTQSGQLYAEALAMAHGKVYTFGPTFRAEKSKTRRHLTEFWMIEPEMAFYDLKMNMDLIEEMLCFIVQTVLQNRQSELAILERDTTKLKLVTPGFHRITYTDALDLLVSQQTKDLLKEMQLSRSEELKALEKEAKELNAESGQAKKGRKFQIEGRLKEIRQRIDTIEEDLRNIPVWKESVDNLKWGDDFGGSDETLLTMQFEKPVMVYNYPTDAKAFYMKKTPGDPKTVNAVDVLAPEGYGEIVGGSQREDNLDEILKSLKKHDLPEEVFKWYLDLRRFGSVPHSGFGLGLERTVAWICGLHHVRETIPFPRMLGRLYP